MLSSENHWPRSKAPAFGQFLVHIYHLGAGADLEGGEKPKGDPWKSKIFLLRGVDKRV